MNKDYIIEGEHDEEFLSKIPRMTVGKHLWDCLNKHDPEAIAEIDALTGQSVTFGELINQGKSLCKTFTELGCGPEDLVVVCCGNELTFTPCLLGCLWSGCICAPIYDGFGLVDYEHIFKQYDPKVIIANTNVYSKIKKVYEKIHNIVKNSPEFIVPLKPEESLSNYKNCLIFSQCLNQPVVKNIYFKPFEIAESGLEKHCCLIMPSSGTTGFPKGVRYTQQSLMNGAQHIYLTRNWKSIMSLTGGYWLTGLILRYAAMKSGSSNVLHIFEPELFLKSIEKYKVTELILTPGYFAIIMNYDWSPYDTTSLKCIFYGGSKIAEEIVKKADEKTDCQKINCYGMTEFVIVHDWRTNVPGSNGKLLPGVKAKVISETGKSLPPNKLGELCIKSKSVFQCYHNNPEATSAALDSKGWLHTGDMVYYNEEGQFFIVDRIKDLIKYQSIHVNTSEIEGIISKLGDVMEVCVVGLTHPVDWEHAKAFIVRKPNSEITENQIIAYVKDRMPDYKWLHGGVQFVDALPKTITGKYLRREIRKMHQTSD